MSNLITDTPSFTIFHDDFSSTLVYHISFLKSKNIFPILIYQFPNHTQAKSNVYKYVSEELRMLIKNLVDFVLHLHSIDKSFVQLYVCYLCFLNGEFRILGLKFRRKDNFSITKDFEFVFEVTKVIFGGSGFVIVGETFKQITRRLR